jgi:chromosomal replication initiator protein
MVYLMKKPNAGVMWQNALKLLENEISEISLNTWIEPMEAISADNGVFLLSVPNDFHKSFVDQYVPLIKNTIKVATATEYDVEIMVGKPESLHNIPVDACSQEQSGEAGGQNKTVSMSRLNPQYTFDSFVVGSGNRYAHAACVGIATTQGGRNYNPLFLYGGSGLGKTHLMHAIGNHVVESMPGKKILYVQCEQFVNEFIYTIKENKYDDFRSKYRNADMLLIDDIQFIEGKEQMQIEFFHTFNTLYESGKNIIMTCDKPPQSLASLEERLRTRFSSGLTIDITPPDYETRVAILRRRAQQSHTVVPDDVYEYIAANIASNIRELEGAFNTVLCYAALAGNITIDIAREALKDQIQPAAVHKVTCSMVMDVVSRYYHVSVEDLKSNRRNKEVTFPRQMAMYICRNMLNMTLPQIGAEFGNRDHTTVMHACSKISDDLEKRSEIAKALDEIKQRLAG